MADLPDPTPERIRAARSESGHSQSAAAAVVHVKLRTWQAWEYGTRQMPMAAWELYQIKTGKFSFV
jgi:DNA (cytosine-5)-methyltransferase 1